ncbi:hypothetical protein AGR8A_Lc40044 [Agrobacterium fabrum str. J-07]|nr:hypothetical protein AGR8A_Lc40044 [Agrobacterium fabrum str. J-07]
MVRLHRDRHPSDRDGAVVEAEAVHLAGPCHPQDRAAAVAAVGQRRFPLRGVSQRLQ